MIPSAGSPKVLVIGYAVFDIRARRQRRTVDCMDRWRNAAVPRRWYQRRRTDKIVMIVDDIKATVLTNYI